ncbi:MAG: VWA domain-containing protein [Planctomycetes bacterium]|nr:VWA domain-containing protein [Planctomycetota bacterium]
MMHLGHPEALLLLPVAALLLGRRLWPRALVGALRLTALVALVVLLAEPSTGVVADGRDVLLVLDRSRSMPDGSEARARELFDRLAAGLRDGDRLGVVQFASDAAVVAAPSGAPEWPSAAPSVDVDGSDLAGGLTAALALIEPGRRGSLLLVSDGEGNGADPRTVARAALRRGVRVDVEPVVHALGVDAAVADLQAPFETAVAAPFAVRAVVVTTTSGAATYRLRIDGEVVRRGEVALREGRNVLQLQHRLDEPGEHRVEVEVALPGDRAPQNDRGLALLRATARPRVLCVTPGGRDDRLTRALRVAGVDLVVRAPAAAPLTLAGLDGFRAVVLENVAASLLPADAMAALETWVRDLGGGLLMTGGHDAFGPGGYHRSPVEAVMPVTMEVREEQRRFGLAMAIALDRSGSMQAQAGDRTKMELADLGAAAAISLMSPIDAVALLAVDTGPHVVQALTPVEQPAALQAVARGIDSAGGGIYVGEALHAAAEQLRAAQQTARHIVLFADAADAEEPGDYRTFVPQLVAEGITVSVIGLGSTGDSDARLLEEIAALGGGRCQFVADANELPRVFAQETIQVARSSVVEEPVEVRSEAALQLLGQLPSLPSVGGYTVAWLRERADRCAVTEDEFASPLLATWHCGLGRAAAFLGEADGELSGALAQWPGYGGMFATLVRWLGGGAPADVFVAARRDGDVGVFTVEVDAARAALLAGATGVGVAPDGRRFDLPLTPLQPGRLEVRVPLTSDGAWRAALQVGEDTLRLPAVCRPFAAEFALQVDPRAGERTLRALARAGGGHVAPSVERALDGERVAFGRRDLGAWWAVAALLSLLLEVAVRRLDLHLPRLVRRARPAAAAAVATSAEPALPAPPPPARGAARAGGGAAVGARTRAPPRRPTCLTARVGAGRTRFRRAAGAGAGGVDQPLRRAASSLPNSRVRAVGSRGRAQSQPIARQSGSRGSRPSDST